jgi:serine/threonine-protein kinase RsbW
MSSRTFPGRYESLAKVAEFVRIEARVAGLTFKDIFELETAVDEAVSNIIEHAYGGEGIGEIVCTCNQIENGIQVILEDHGQPFDPSCVPLPDLNAELKNRKNNGLGYFLMCQLMDDVRFEFTAKSNRLTLTKHSK